MTDGRILNCGYNGYGQLGHGDTANKTRFEQVNGIPAAIYEVGCGDYYTMIRFRNGNVMSCGFNSSGQLGHGDTANKTVFEEIKAIPKNISEMSCGDRHMMIRLTDGKLMSCGYNYFGHLGHGDKIDRTTFEKIKGWKIEINGQ